ncbi:hypothetical protein [Sandaracinus amylolyticus]|uniref:hypothetical protein n=1 Tax=Sandaracinus amylolyticus TaxID=927083 RepID=UPI001F2C916F|nr:hypothetical protein [Sandaracinus amylolyticus]UJR79752.1 Hypothetical protein I5071_17900 [Sandaracinus amylolyticus]
MLPTAAIVRADEPDPEVSSEPAAATRDIWDRMLAVELVGGLDTPYGVFGGAVVISPIRHLALDVGGGVSRDGGRVAGGARLVLPHANGALGVRVGFAGGPLTWESAVPGHNVPGDEVHTRDGVQRQTWEFVGFVDVSLSLEVRFDLGIYARFLFGVEHALSGPTSCEERIDGESIGPCSASSFQPTRTYVGLAVGYAFDI